MHFNTLLRKLFIVSALLLISTSLLADETECPEGAENLEGGAGCVCPEGSVYHPKKNKCLKCPQDVSDNGECTCRDNNFYDPTLNICRPCPKDSKKDESGKCVCNDGMVYDTNKNGCFKCPEGSTGKYPNCDCGNLVYDPDKNECLGCPAGSTGTYPECNCGNKIIYNPLKNICLKCPDNGNGYPNCECDGNQVYNSETNECVTCPDDSTLVNNHCVCDDETKTYNAKEKICGCSEGSTEINGKCVCEDDRMIMNPNTRKCECDSSKYYCKNGDFVKCTTGKDSNGQKFNGIYVLNNEYFPQPENIGSLTNMKKVNEGARWCKPTKIFKCTYTDKETDLVYYLSDYPSESSEPSDKCEEIDFNENNINAIIDTEEFCDDYDNNLDGKKNIVSSKKKIYGFGVSLPEKFQDDIYTAIGYDHEENPTEGIVDTTNKCKLSRNIPDSNNKSCNSAKFGKLKCTKTSKITKMLECSASLPKGTTEKCGTEKDYNCDGIYNNISVKKCKVTGAKGKTGSRCNPRGVKSCFGQSTTTICTDYDHIITNENTRKKSVKKSDSKEEELSVNNSDKYNVEKNGLKPNVNNAKTEDGSTLAAGTKSPLIPCWEVIEDEVVFSCASVNKDDCKNENEATEDDPKWLENSNPLSCNQQYYAGQSSEKGWICNGRDDNCNGKIDENINYGKSCKKKVNGITTYGTYKCVLGKKECFIDENDLQKDSLSNVQLTNAPIKSKVERAEDCGTSLSTEDSDGDGVADYLDECPNNPFKNMLASDSICGSLEDKEADTDNDGVPDYLDGCVYNSNKVVYTFPFLCGNEYDQADSDGDGVIDAIDECPTDRNKSEEGVCGCNDEDQDIDNNGVMDCMQFQGGEEHYFDVTDTPRTPYLKLANNTIRIRMENVVPAYNSSDDAVIRYEVNIINEQGDNIKALRKVVKKPFAKVKNAKGIYSISYRVISRDGGNTTKGEWSNAKVIVINE